MEKINSIVSLIKELQVLLAALGFSSVLAVSNLELALEYAEKYNLHIIATMFTLSIITYKLSNRRIDKVENKLEDITKKAAKDNLRANVRQLAKELSGIEEITFQHTIKHILELEERRKELGVNSYTEATLKDMIERIKA